MSIIFGFGSTEEQQRKTTFKKAEEILSNLCKDYKKTEKKGEYFADYFNDDILDKFKKEFGKYTKVIRDEYDKADKLDDRPERYYHISNGQRFSYDYDTFFIEVDFWHINSKHPFSPDGMSLFSIKECMAFHFEDLIN